jgi:hypothetical protein
LWNGSSKPQFLNDICTFSVRGCWDQPILFFWKLVDETLISKSQDFRTTYKQILACIFLHCRPSRERPLGKIPEGGLQGFEGSFQGIFHLERPLRPL